MLTRRAGGEVVILAGNHEAEFLADPAAAKGNEFAKQLESRQHHRSGRGGGVQREIGEFLAPFRLRRAWATGSFRTAATRAEAHRRATPAADLQGGVEHDGFPYQTTDRRRFDSGVPAPAARAEACGSTRERPVAANGNCSRITPKLWGVAHVVEGHVPSPVVFTDGVKRNRGEMFQRFGLLFLIDTGMSEGVDDSGGAVLHITYRGGERATAICPDGRKTLLWDSGSKQDIYRAAKLAQR